ncbi:MAG: glycosyltransferase family 2 protein [Chitinophagia bacterium]|nr:glycosyltransferase family 2 protein [Chitinophagia bacterium]
MNNISCVIITFNEERHIRDAIQSALQVADEVVVVDSYSTDDTVKIASELGAKVFFRKFAGFGAQKAFAVEHATHDWILSMDADERLSPELRDSILAVKQNPTCKGYQINVLTNYCGKWIKNCGWYPKYKLRLLHRSHAHINDNKVHEGFEMNSRKEKMGVLKGDLMHYSYENLSEHSKKIEFYTELAARNCADNKKSIPLIKLILGPKWSFFYHFVLRKGFMDGYMGYVLCSNISYESFIKYTKIRLYYKEKWGGRP